MKNLATNTYARARVCQYCRNPSWTGVVTTTSLICKQPTWAARNPAAWTGRARLLLVPLLASLVMR